MARLVTNLTFLLLTTLMVVKAHSADGCRGVVLSGTIESPVSQLHRRHIGQGEAYLNQKSGEKTCGHNCAINLFEAIRAAEGMRPLFDSKLIHQSMVEKFSPYVENKNGIYPSDLIQLLVEFGGKLLGGRKFSVRTKTAIPLSKTTHEVHEFEEVVQKITVDDITPRENEYVIISYVKIDINTGKKVGSHFVLVSAVEKNRIEVLDPNHVDVIVGGILGLIKEAGEHKISTLQIVPFSRTFWGDQYQNKSQRFFVKTVTRLVLDKD